MHNDEPGIPKVCRHAPRMADGCDSAAILAALRVLTHKKPLHPVLVPVAVYSLARVPTGTPPTKPVFVGLRSRRDHAAARAAKRLFLSLDGRRRNRRCRLSDDACDVTQWTFVPNNDQAKPPKGEYGRGRDERTRAFTAVGRQPGKVQYLTRGDLRRALHVSRGGVECIESVAGGAECPLGER